MASTAFSSARSRRILRNGPTAAHRRRSRGCIRPGVRTDPDCARAGAGGRFPDGAADPAVASRCRARASIRPSSPEARARSGRTSRRRSSPRSASRVASRIGTQRSATGDDDRDDEARHDRDDEAGHDRDDRAFGGHDRRKQSRRSQRPRVRPHAGRGVRTRPSAPRPGRCRPRGNRRDHRGVCQLQPGLHAVRARELRRSPSVTRSLRRRSGRAARDRRSSRGLGRSLR